ncbi:MAG: LysR family transcriptional regulator, partial [Amylibacter sp.]|nr:LysR family transcriptional regulator [Amylibacter sp.]
MSVKLRQLEAFYAVGQLGSMTLAAKKLNISQPAVSRLLASYSESIEFKLFNRQNGKLVPTQDARFLLREVGRLLDSLEHIDEITHSLTSGNAGHLKIACLPGFSTSHMPRVLSEFLINRPNVTVNLEPDGANRIFEWIISEQYDCGITDVFSDHPAVKCQRIPMKTVCIMSEGNTLGKKKFITPEDLINEPMIHSRRDSAFYRKLEEVFTLHNVKINSWIETRQFNSACMLVAEGRGVSIV